MRIPLWVAFNSFDVLSRIIICQFHKDDIIQMTAYIKHYQYHIFNTHWAGGRKLMIFSVSAAMAAPIPSAGKNLAALTSISLSDNVRFR
jgi:hypothetical protein